MLSYSLGFETVDRWSRLDGRGLGFETVDRWSRLDNLGDYTEGVCAQGANFLCGPKDGVFSCRPCTKAGLDVFRDLQGQLNRLVVAKGLPKSLLLDIDGRFGPKTVTTALAVSNRIRMDNPGAAFVPAGSAGARWLAVNAEGLAKELKSNADGSGAPTKPPEPPKAITVAPVPADVVVPPAPKSRAGLIVGGLAVVTAAGLITAAVQFKKKR